MLGNDGRCSLIGREAGFANVGADAQPGTSTHGNEASFEFLVDKDPDYLFVLDRDAAIGTDGAKLAQEVVENELMKGTAAYRDGRIVYLAHPAVWYSGMTNGIFVRFGDVELSHDEILSMAEQEH